MSMSNIEARARAHCEALSARVPHETPAARVASIDRTWEIAAAYIEAGLIDDEGRDRPHSHEEAWQAVKDWRARHPKIARIG